jgi:subtilisin
VKPAHSELFEPERLRPVSPVPLGGGITPEWAWGSGTGAGVRVAVVDSGVDWGHPDVGLPKGGVVVEEDPAARDRVRIVEGEHEDVFGHGTACAGVIRRVAPDCELYSVRVLGGRLGGKAQVLAAGLRWAIDQGMHVVNLSLGTHRREHFAALHELADEAFFAGMMLVCAANNLPLPTFPAEYASVFSVAAHAGHDPFRFDYNDQPPIEFGAPGIDVEVPWRGGGRIQATGNSFAAPHISGLVARILSVHPGMTPFQMKAVLLELADNARPEN